MYELNRFKDLIFVDKTTPLSVLFFIIKTNPCMPTNDYSHITDVKKLCEIISTSEKMKIDLNNISNKDLTYIATFINPVEREWTKKTILKAFKHYVNNIGTNNLDFEKTGSKSNKQPERTDIIMLCRYCQDNNIITSKDDTTKTLTAKIKYNNLQPKDIVSKIITRLKIFNKEDLISFLVCLKSKPNHKNSTYDGKSFNTPENYDICSRTYYTDEEAVFVGAQRFHIDFRDSSCPSLELSVYSFHKNNYIPVCNKFKERYLKNKDYYNLTKFWKPEFSRFYNEPIYQILANSENLTRSEKIDIQSSLNGRYLLKNFYFGYLPFLDIQETFIYNNDICSTPREEIICYGIMESKSFIVLTVEEIEATFRSYSNFLEFENPNEKIEDYALSKLIKICEDNKENSNYSKLLDTIDDVKVKIRLMESVISEFSKLYKDEKSKIDDFVNCLFEASMYMRGWKVGDKPEYPMKSEHCNWAVENHLCDIFKNTSDSLKKLNECVDSMDKKLKKIVLKLPLICYHLKGFLKSKSKEEGLTVMERIDIVKEGTSVYSCIRMSSNNLAASAYYYHNVVKNEKLFNIKEMDSIS